MQTPAPGTGTLTTEQRLAALLYGDNLRVVEEIAARGRGDPTALVSTLVELRRTLGPLTAPVLRDASMRAEIDPDKAMALAVAHGLVRSVQDPHPLGLCINGPCAARGGAEVERVFREKLIPFEELPCQGSCDLGPIACYSRGAPLGISAARARSLSKADPRDWEDLLSVEKPVHAFKTEPRVVFANLFAKSSHQLATAKRHGVYLPVEASSSRSSAEVLEAIAGSGLRGDDGREVAAALRGARGAPGTDRALIANGVEVEPGSFKDRALLERDPHLVIAGAILAARAMEASEIFLCVRAEYELAFERVRGAAEEATRAGYLGSGEAKTSLKVRLLPGSYRLTDPRQLLDALEGRVPAPHDGDALDLFGRPAATLGVEVLAAIPAIVTGGGDAYRALGLEGAGGTKVVSLGGDVKRPGAYEVRRGAKLGGLIEQLGEGLLQGKRVIAVQVGGASQRYLPPEALEAGLDDGALAELGGAVGTGAVVAITEKSCLWSMAKREAAFFAREGCGGCEGCAGPLSKLGALLEALDQEDGARESELRALGEELAGKGCPPTRGAARPAVSVLDRFGDALREHRARGCICFPRRRGKDGGAGR